jgi:hypothetical protein
MLDSGIDRGIDRIGSLQLTRDPHLHISQLEQQFPIKQQ